MCFDIDENQMETKNSSENEEIVQNNENMDKNMEDNTELDQIMEDTRADEITCDNKFDKEHVFNLLEKLYPNLREEIMYTAPEILWLKIKHITGVDIIKIMNAIEINERKRKIDSPASPDVEYSRKHFKNM